MILIMHATAGGGEVHTMRGREEQGADAIDPQLAEGLLRRVASGVYKVGREEPRA